MRTRGKLSLDRPEWWLTLDEYIAQTQAANPGHVQSALIPVLHYVQDTFGYVPEKAINHVAQALGVPTAYVMGVASFYSYFSLEPRGRFNISVCMGTACYVQGAQAVVDEFARQLSVQPGQTTPDGMFSLREARCLGCCGQAPAAMINETVYARVTPEQVANLLARCTEEAQQEPPAAATA